MIVGRLSHAIAQLERRVVTRRVTARTAGQHTVALARQRLSSPWVLAAAVGVGVAWMWRPRRRPTQTINARRKRPDRLKRLLKLWSVAGIAWRYLAPFFPQHPVGHNPSQGTRGRAHQGE